MPNELNVTLEDESPVIEVQIIGTGPVGPTGGPGPAGPEGPAGSDGVSPEVTITAIPGGHRVTITDAEHPTGQSFDVMDGESGGGAVSSVNGQTGTVVLDAEDVGAYELPSGGIPKTDLASDVQTSLGKADTALQQHQSLSAYRTAAAQDVIDAGKADKITEITVSTAGAVTQALDAGKIYHFTGALSSLTITLNAAASGVIAQYHFDFTAGSTVPTLTVPSTVIMPDGFAVKANERFEIDILNGYGAVMSWAIS